MTEHGGLSTEDWQMVRAIFTQVVDLPHPEAVEQIKNLCQQAESSNSELIEATVIKMLGIDQGQAELTVTPQASAIETLLKQKQLNQGDLLGKYQILKKIGSGGMGQVYLAQRDDEVRQLLAIKTVDRRLIDERSQQRFDTERRILASLEHPNIARLIDAGTEGDQAFYVMEYVEGIAIDQYCTTKQLNLNQRLLLFLEICKAVNYAHNNLVVHRDLKPSNILVTADGQVKLLDFGIAKPLKVLPGTEQLQETLVGTAALTPQYAAPEQLKGQTITVACDVYVLGLLLYQLITDQHAFDLDGKTWGEIEKIVAQDLPGLPSKRLLKNNHKNKPDWGHKLKGDLDAIVSHALKKEPESRYSNVKELAADIQHFLHHEPIQIKSNQTLYRLQKNLRKHWLACSAAAIIFSVLTVSSWLIWQQSQTIKAERDKALTEKRVAEEVTDFLVETFESADPKNRLGTKITAADILRQGEYQINSTELDARVKNRLVAALGTVYLSLAEFDAATTLLEQYKPVLSDDSQNQKVSLTKAQLHKKLGDKNAALSLIEQLEKVLQPHSEAAIETAIIKSELLLSMGDQVTAKKLSQALLDQTQRQFGENSLWYVKTLINHSNIKSEVGNQDESLDEYLLAKVIMEQFFPEKIIELAEIYNKLSRFYRKKFDHPNSLKYVLAAKEAYHKIYGESHLQISVSEHLLGNTKKRMGLYTEAIEHYERAIEIKSKYYDDEAPQMASLYYSIAAVLSSYLNQNERSLDYYEKAFRCLDQASGRGKQNLQIMRIEYTGALIELGQTAKAIALLDEMIDYFKSKNRIAGLNLAASRAYLAAAYIKEKEFSGAIILLNQAIDVLRDRLSKTDTILIRAELNLSKLNALGFF